MKRIGVVLLSLLLAACAGSSKPPKPAAGAAGPPSQSKSQIAEIASTPLSDLNLVRTKIPPVLLEARKHPYALPKDPGCGGLASDIQALDIVLGADLDVPPAPDDPGMVERGAVLIGDAAMGAVRGAAEGIIPFRHWVRKLTGAERHSKEVAAAIAAGIVRRAYLKGLGQAAGCQPPAAPRGKPEDDKPSQEAAGPTP